METEIIKTLKHRAKKDVKTIVLPEAEDLRILEATDRICKEEFSKIILVGNKENIVNKANEHNLDISKAEIVEPLLSEKYEKYANDLYELRKQKGMTLENAKELLK